MSADKAASPVPTVEDVVVEWFNGETAPSNLLDVLGIDPEMPVETLRRLLHGDTVETKYDALVAAMAFTIAAIDPTIHHGRNDESSSERADFCNEIWHELGDQAGAVMDDIFDHAYLSAPDNTDGPFMTDSAASPVLALTRTQPKHGRGITMSGTAVERAFCRMFEMMSADDGECVWIAVEPERLPGAYQYTTGQTFDLAPALGDNEWSQMRDLYDAIDLDAIDLDGLP